MLHHTHPAHRGIHAIHFGMLSGLVLITFLASIFMVAASPLWINPANAAVVPFSGGAMWHSPIPAYTELHNNSDIISASVTQQVAQFGTAVYKESASPMYEVDASTPTVQVTYWDCGIGTPASIASEWQTVPVPFYAVPSSGGNPQMIISQPSSGTIWEFGHMRNVAGQWQACSGGKISSQSDGVFPAPFGVSSSGIALAAGQLSYEDVRSGSIDHVIGLSLPRTNSFIAPATQGSQSYNGAPALGARLRLDPSVDVSSLGLNAIGQAIARAAQTYGFIVWNNNSSVAISVENPISKTQRGIPDPYNQVAGVETALNNFPWHKLQALPDGQNFSAVTPSITHFAASSQLIRANETVQLTWQSRQVTRCAIPGVSSNLPASGSITTSPLRESTSFVLRCGGPTGAASSQIHVQVARVGQNDPLPTLEPGFTFDLPFSGYANILPDLMPDGMTELVYKVVYYEGGNYLFETAKQPYALNTVRMQNGDHVVDARIYYRDGRVEQRSVGFSIQNNPETLFAVTQSGVINSPGSLPWQYALLGSIIALSGMALGSWWGWHKAHRYS